MFKRGIVLSVILWAATAAVLWWSGKTAPMLAWIGLPVVLLVVTMPRLALILFLLSVAVYAPHHTPLLAIHPFDIAALLFLVSVVIDFLLRGRVRVIPSGYDTAFVLLIGAVVLSALFAHNRAVAVVPTLRIIFIYLVFRCIYEVTLRIGVRRIVLFYIAQVIALSLLNVVIFIMKGGGVRVYGPAWLAFEPYAMTAFPMALVFLLLSVDRWARLRWGAGAFIILLAVLATQARGPLLALVLSLPVVWFTARHYRKRFGVRLAVVRPVVGLAVVAGVLLAVFSATLYAGWLERVERFIAALSDPQGTVALRLTLWRAALQGFLHDPLTGIGIGNFRSIEAVLPTIRLDPLWRYVSTMSAHNVVLHYLCETGVIGTAALLWLAWRGLRQSFRTFARAGGYRDAQVAGALFVALVVFAVTLFYMRAWTWGQEGFIMAMLFAFSAAAAGSAGTTGTQHDA